MPRPTLTPWAQNLVVVPGTGQNNRVLPPAGWQNEGWSKDEKPALNYQNYMEWETWQWKSYLRDACKRPASAVVRASAGHPAGAEGEYDYLCDGTADQVEIQAAIDAVGAAGGGTVLLSEGTFTIAAGINLRDKVQVAGMGAGTILQVLSTTASDFAVLLATAVSNASVVNLAIDGNIAGAHGHFHSGIQITGASMGILLERLWLRNFAMSGGNIFGYGIEVTGTSFRTHIANVTTYDCRNQGVKAGSTNLTQLTKITGSTMRGGGAGGGGVYVVGGAGVQVLGCEMYQVASGVQVSYSLDPAPPTDVLVSGNLIVESVGWGIYARGSRITISGTNIILRSGSGGVWAEEMDLSLIGGNIIDTAQLDGVWLDNCDFAKVANNLLTDVSQAAHNTSDYVAINDGNSADVHGNTMRATVGVTGRYGVWEDAANAPTATLCYGNQIGGAGASGTVLLIPGVGEAGAGTGITLPHVLWDPVALPAGQWVGDSTIAVMPAGGLAQAPQRAAQLANF